MCLCGKNRETEMLLNEHISVSLHVCDMYKMYL